MDVVPEGREVREKTARYARFLPARYRVDGFAPTSTWWPWRGHDVHILRVETPGSKVRVLVLHGAGGHAGALWPFAGVAAAAGADVLAPDLPLYGHTRVPAPKRVRYDDWVECVSDLVRRECENDDRPLVVFGASMGGLLGYEVAARTRQVAHVVATCLLDPADPAARAAAARVPVLGRAAPKALRSVDRYVGGLAMPIRWLVKMTAMSADPELTRQVVHDSRGGGVHIPLGFLSSWLNFSHTAPEQFDAAPVTLVHPGADEWTPPSLSIRFLDRMPAPTRTVLLRNCGHYPIEEPGLSQLVEALYEVRDSVLASAAQQPFDQID
ncbi:alpha/beta hydrolase [Mycolicibacterium goodii]|uniref:alpha/beta hydrolase n=1 Tax=Mycolicibacterium goodii TaxID=134601 RepID=UPI001BDDC721|nr:alpha/beta fold hydrolase [Mycolicibacterium goodii]MBU8828263.1 alpha/beta fold hydrolase [Mycolicibacterium goodii]